MFVGHFDWKVALYGVVDGVLTPDECAALIARVRDAKWLPATVNGPDGRYRNEKLRDNDLALVADESLRRSLFERLASNLPATISGQALHSVHPSLRIYRYQKGQHFGPHSDQPYFDAEGRQSKLTLIVYLDEACVGGETAFLEIEDESGSKGVVIQPCRGRVLWFQHMLVHEGRRVVEGVKHVLRTDAIYA